MTCASTRSTPANISLFNDTGFTPTDFHAGNFIASQWTTNFDVDREFEVGMASPLNVAIGLEHRHETYQIKAGDPASRYKEGAQSYPGFALTDAKEVSRDNEAVYVDFAVSPIDKLQLDIAGRFEHFSDFGDTSVGKVTGPLRLHAGIRPARNVQHGISRPDARGGVLFGDERVAVIGQRSVTAEFTGGAAAGLGAAAAGRF